MREANVLSCPTNSRMNSSTASAAACKAACARDGSNCRALRTMSMTRAGASVSFSTTSLAAPHSKQRMVCKSCMMRSLSSKLADKNAGRRAGTCESARSEAASGSKAMTPVTMIVSNSMSPSALPTTRTLRNTSKSPKSHKVAHATWGDWQLKLERMPSASTSTAGSPDEDTARRTSSGSQSAPPPESSRMAASTRDCIPTWPTTYFTAFSSNASRLRMAWSAIGGKRPEATMTFEHFSSAAKLIHKAMASTPTRCDSRSRNGARTQSGCLLAMPDRKEASPDNWYKSCSANFWFGPFCARGARPVSKEVCATSATRAAASKARL
mmetsp:Transcript_88455/g.249286  ORF Transcript_88455/g.249286 Transcript_88455/m.249286 type:complete len:325 (-) Transcript_88455:1378-2352(-)